ncbi:MAG: hypothetical protein P1V35_16855, partial [Planctomycetota bacterium]|nr:hypothetical protein [Planctomycetota bacterium]
RMEVNWLMNAAELEISSTTIATMTSTSETPACEFLLDRRPAPPLVRLGALLAITFMTCL